MRNILTGDHDQTTRTADGAEFAIRSQTRTTGTVTLRSQNTICFSVAAGDIIRGTVWSEVIHN